MNIFCYSFHISDFRRSTAHMTHEQKGVYRELLDAYYFSSGNLPAELAALSRIVSVHTDSERTALAGAVAKFFDIKNGKLTHKRADLEIGKIRAKSLSAKASAEAKYRKRREKEPCERISERSANGHANAMLITNQEPITIFKESEREKPISTQENFAEFWSIYPRHVAKQSALKAYNQARQRGVSHEDIIAGARQFADECRGREQRWIAHPATWLNAGRWDDEPGANLDSSNGRQVNGRGGHKQQPKSRGEIVVELIGELPENQRGQS